MGEKGRLECEGDIQRKRKVKMRQGWCRRVGGGRGQRKHNIAEKGMEENDLLGSLKNTGQKKAQKRAVQADGWQKQRISG